MVADGMLAVPTKMSKSVVSGIPSNLLDIFWSLAEGTEDVRIKSSNEIVLVLQGLQGKSKTPCKGLQYAVQRLVRGVASDRKWARLGYSLALTHVLRSFAQVSVQDVLKSASQELQTANADAKSERSNIMLGKVMVYIALVRSSRLQEAGDKAVDEVIKNLLEILAQKKSLHLITTQTLVDIITQFDKDEFSSAVWPRLSKALNKGWQKCEPDTLLLLLAALKHKKVIGDEFLSEHWGGTPLINKDNAEHIANVVMASTRDHPILHGVCTALTELAGKKAKTLKLFWENVIIGNLLESGFNRKYICLKLVPVALKCATSADQVRMILCPPMVNLIFKSLVKDAVLQGCARPVCADVVEFVGRCEDSEIQSAVMMSVLELPCSYQFDFITGTKTIANMVPQLNPEALNEFVAVFKGIIMGADVLSESEKLDGKAMEAKKKWASHMLTLALSNKNVSADSDICISVMRFMFLHSFFQLTKADKKLPECDRVLQSPMSEGLRNSLQEGFFKALTKFSTVMNDRSKKPKAYIDTLYELVQYSRSLFQSKCTKRLNEMENVPELIDEILGKVEKMRKEKPNVDRENQSLAFQLLFLQLSLQLFTDASQAEAALQDLTVCYEKASLKNRRVSMKKNTGEPDWVEVVVELLLSLLSLDSRMNRVIAAKVLSFLRPHLTPGAINLIMQVFKSGPEGEIPLDFEDDEEDMEEDETEGCKANGHNDSKDENESEEEDEDSSSDEDEDDMEVNEDLRKAVKEALGKAAVNSDDEEEDDVDMDDDAMLRLDDAIAAAFKGMSSKNAKKMKKEKTVQLKNFRMRCLDLVTSLVIEQTPPSLLLLLCQPLLELLDSATRNKDGKQEEKRLQNLQNKLMKLRNLPPDPTLNVEELPSMVQTLISYSTKVSGIPMIMNVASTCLFVMRLILRSYGKETTSPVKTRAMRAGGAAKAGSEQQTPQDEVLEIIENSLADFCKKRDTRLNHMLFHTMCERQPVLLWPLTEKLLDLTLSSEIRVFCKTKTASILSAMINKNTAQNIEESWSEFSSSLIKRITECLLDDEDTEIKPRYVYELLVLLHRTVISSKEDVLDFIPDEFVAFLLKIHESQKQNRDLITLCNQLHSRICKHKGINNELKNRKKQTKESPKIAKKRKLSETTEDAPTTEVTEKPQKKKKKHKSNKLKKGSLQFHSSGLESLES